MSHVILWRYAPRALVAPPTPTEWYTMDEASGATRAGQITSPTNDLTDNGTVDQAAGVVGNASVHDGADYLEGGDIHIPSAGPVNLTLAWWEYLTILPSTDDRDMYAVCRWTGASFLRSYNSFIRKADDIMQVSGENSDDEGFHVLGTNRGALSIETWYGFVAVFDPNRTGKEVVLYSGVQGMDDFRVDDVTVQPATGDLICKLHDPNFTVGGFASDAGVRSKARFDVVCYWGEPLSENQARGYINKGRPLNPPF